MTKTELVIVLPGMANVLGQKINASILPPYLSKIINKARFQADSTGLQRLLLSHFSQMPITGADLPIVSALLGQEGILRADPCYLHPDRDRLLLFADNLDISFDEAQGLIAEIQILLDEWGGELICEQADKWFLRLKSMPDISFSALPEVSGKNVQSFLPVGADRQDWIRLWNEIQMKLYDCDINQQRVNNGKLPINSIWFWGAGEFIAKDKAWASIQGGHPLLEKLAVRANCSIKNTTDYCTGSLKSGQNLWLLEDIDTEADWQQQLQQLDVKIFDPLWQHCKTNKLSTIRLQIPEYGEYSITPFDCWKFW